MRPVSRWPSSHPRAKGTRAHGAGARAGHHLHSINTMTPPPPPVTHHTPLTPMRLSTPYDTAHTPHRAPLTLIRPVFHPSHQSPSRLPPSHASLPHASLPHPAASSVGACQAFSAGDTIPAGNSTCTRCGNKFGNPSKLDEAQSKPWTHPNPCTYGTENGWAHEECIT